MPTGTTVTMPILLTDADRAIDGTGGSVDVYGSPAMVRHLEVVSRWLLQQCLQEGEAPAGTEIALANLHPVGVDGEVALTAVVRESSPDVLVVDLEFHRGDVLAATGTCTQRPVGGAAADHAVVPEPADGQHA